MRSDDVELCDWQYTIRFELQDFRIGEIVFLKSNPEWPMFTCNFDGCNVVVEWESLSGEMQRAKIHPHCLMKYEYAAFQTYKMTDYHVCLN